MHAAAGRVRTHATTMLPATPQRTADSRLAAPEPITAPEIVWVVESGKPTCEAARITAAPAPWAAKPWAESILWIRLPIVRMIRQPPTYVPAAIAVAAEATTQVGGVGSLAGSDPCATSTSAITPIVF